MNAEEIMQEYTNTLKKKYQNYENFDLSDENEKEWFRHLDEEKEKIHSVAIAFLSKILTPELKVFVRNLCYNKLGYPDEPVFYEVFGDYPEVGDRVEVAELEKKGINQKAFCDLLETWEIEGNWIDTETFEGKEYYVIKSLYEMDDEPSEEKLKRLRGIEKIKKRLLDNKNTLRDGEKFEEINKMLDSMIPKNWKI